jgi:predicted AlkP superfamily pyrophosphatase or phosphodiesterase
MTKGLAMYRHLAFAAIALSSASAACAKPQEAMARAPAAPTLIIAVSVDQFSSILFEEYRSAFTGGLKRLAADGTVFVSGYQSHAATETCPGHSTILTGDHPTRTGIIANNWMNLDQSRDDKGVYCAEDESVKGTDSKNYTVSAVHLKVPTLGDRLKALNPATRVVSVAGKDRAAIMMGGHSIDQAWWWTNSNKTYQFVSFAGSTAPAIVATVNARMKSMVDNGYSYPAYPALCQAKIAPIQFGDRNIGARAVPKGDGSGLYTHIALDQATLDIATGLIDDMRLGQGSAPDVLAIGLSVTDPVGHAFGTEGPEMCGQLAGLDVALGVFLTKLDATGIRYALVLTADHGGGDIPERKEHDPKAVRLDSSIRPLKLDIDLGIELNIPGHAIYSDSGEAGGNLYISHDLAPDLRATVAAAARKHLAESPFVEAVFSRDEIMAAPKPNGQPGGWSSLQRVAASYDPLRSGDLYVVLKERVQTVSDPSGSVMAHGSVWDYDRRVPIIFYGKGLSSNDNKSPIETVDIMPTLAAMSGVKLATGEVDGTCLETVTTCPK